MFDRAETGTRARKEVGEGRGEAAGEGGGKGSIDIR